MTSDKPRPTLTLVIPTVGRPTLARTLLSVRQQDWWPGDEVLLVGDGPCPRARALWQQFHLPGRYLESPQKLGYWGHGIRNWLIADRLMRGEYVVALDDDDVSARNAMVTIRERIMDFPNRPLIFRMSGHPTVGTVWKEKTLALGNVGTPCLVAPNDPSRLAQYTPRYGGDFDFIRDTCAFYPDGPVWREEVICEVRPHLNRR